MSRSFGFALLLATAMALSGCGRSGRVALVKPSQSPSPSPAQNPQITSVLPSSVTAGGPAFLLSVNGSHLEDPDHIEGPFAIYFGPNMLSTTVVSDILLTATVPAQDITTAGTIEIWVGSPDFGSNLLSFQIMPPAAQVLPSEVTLGPKGSQQFTANIGGSGSVTWSVEEGASGGSVTDTGLYTPKGPGAFHVMATSTTDSSETATATISVVAAGFAETGSMHSARSGHTATLLNDGRILILGGGDGTAELFDPGSSTFSLTGNPVTNRACCATATRLADGRVLIAGGLGTTPLTANGHLPPLSNAEIFDPTTGKFGPVGDMIEVRWKHTATLLSDGKVLMAGGNATGFCTVASAELFDPATGTFSATGYLLSDRGRVNHTATLLSTGKVLIAGGSNGCAPDAADDPPWDPMFVELYDSLSGSFQEGGTLSTTRTGHVAIRLASDKVLVMGGVPSLQNIHDQPSSLAYAEIYDPASHAFLPLDGLKISRSGYSATLLPSGRILIVGGQDANGHSVSAADLLDPNTGTLTVTGALAQARVGHTATLLKDGRVLVTGGTDGDGNVIATGEIYQ